MARKNSFPRYVSKVGHRSLVEPRVFVRRYLPGVRAPSRCVFLWNPPLTRRLVRRFRGQRIEGLGGTYSISDTHSGVGIVLPRGVGAPTTVIRAEELSALGTREFLGVGYAGSLTPELRPGDVVVCTGAVRDEGTSHHYAPPHVLAVPSPLLRRWVEKTLTHAGIPFVSGRSWTTDAVYRETRPELRHYRRTGVLTVDMEASAMFVFGRHRRVRVAFVFVISDVLRERGWTPHFHQVGGMLDRVATALLTGSTGGSVRAARPGRHRLAEPTTRRTVAKGRGSR
jgi:uridine phosphorylase